jgi:hypothetical protein
MFTRHIGSSDVDYSSGKVDICQVQSIELEMNSAGIKDDSEKNEIEPLRGVLIGLVISLPLWAFGFLIFKLF